MEKKAFFFIDDIIWLFRDLARQRPASLFVNSFLAHLKEAHQRFGLKVQLNVFYRTDFYYGSDEFTLAEMPDIYKAEWEANADWLKLGFHSKQEFPDYPFVNASYHDVKVVLDAIKHEIFRFAGPDSFAHAVVTHWLPISKEGCRALLDGGIKIVSASGGTRGEYNGDPSSLPYGHTGRLLQNRKPETGVYKRGTRDKAIDNSICAHNHMTTEEVARTRLTLNAYRDPEAGIYFKKFCNGPCLNLSTKESLPMEVEKTLGSEFFGYATHEQYFYPEYFAYQPEYMEKIFYVAKILAKNGYTHFFIEEVV